MLTKGQKIGITADGRYVAVTQHAKAIGVVINQPSIDGVARVDVYRGAESIAGGPSIEMKAGGMGFQGESGDAVAKPAPAGLKLPLERTSPMAIKPLDVLVGPIECVTGGVCVPANVRATVLRAERIDDSETKLLEAVLVRLRRWDTDQHVIAELKPSTSLRIDHTPEES